MQRIFITEDTKNILEIRDNNLINQFLKVLRLKIWDNVIFFNWKENIDYIYKLKDLQKKILIFEQIESISKNNSQKNELNLYQAIPNKIDKIELILQKWTEIGYHNFYFFKSARSQKINISENKITRFNKIIQEACEQSWRNIIPKIFFLEKIEKIEEKNLNIFFHTDKKISKKINELNFSYEKINIFIWPEWGFDEKEINFFKENNMQPCTLWENILRCETAAITSGFTVKYLLDL